VEVKGRREGDEWIFSVVDNGVGFDQSYSERIFQIFQRLQSRAESEGTGIGLAIASRIVQRHGGRIWAESEVGKGSVSISAFRLKGDEDLNHRAIEILLVEDNPGGRPAH